MFIASCFSCRQMWQATGNRQQAKFMNNYCKSYATCKIFDSPIILHFNIYFFLLNFYTYRALRKQYEQIRLTLSLPWFFINKKLILVVIYLIFIYLKYFTNTVVTNIKRNACRLLHSCISISKKERRRKLFRFNLVTTV